LKKVTIITATFNSANTVKDTLQSVVFQDYPSIEHIIIDGLSKDETLSIIETFPHINSCISEPDKGLYDAMNKGISLATGDIIGILNSDDFYTHPKVLSNVVSLMEKTGAAILYADLEYVHPMQTSKVVRCWKAGAYQSDCFLHGWMPPHPTLFVRREVYEQYGGFNLNLQFSADYELMLRFIHRYGLAPEYLPEVIVRMRTGGVSNSSFKNRWKANREDKLAWSLNGIQPHIYTTWLKPFLKIRQYFPESE
jgi:glycosyltransferase involved in cell wall biosynthesis